MFDPNSAVKQPSFAIQHVGTRAFRISAPKACNCLSHNIRLEACTNSFKWKL